MKGVSLLPPSLGAVEDRGVVDPGEDEVALGDMRLVLLALLDGRVGGVEVLVALEALDGLRGQVAVGHRMPQDGDALARLAQQARDVARGLALAGARAHRADRDDRLLRGQHRLARREQPEGRAGGERARRDVHHVLVRDVRVREDDLVHVVPGDQLLELRLRRDRNPVRIQLARQLLRIDAPVDVRDLRRREGDDLVLLAAAVDEVEVVKVPTGRTCDENPCPCHA
jgi:hypothetical protein